jgi:hypothetical protein
MQSPDNHSRSFSGSPDSTALPAGLLLPSVWCFDAPAAALDSLYCVHAHCQCRKRFKIGFSLRGMGFSSSPLRKIFAAFQMWETFTNEA